MNYNSNMNLKMNSYNDLDFYNIQSTFKNDKSLLINKNIDNYFNEIINIPEQPKTFKIINKNNSFFNIFYRDYLENNMLLLFVIFIIIIFLAIRYYTKDMDNENFQNNTYRQKNILYKKKLNNKKNNLKIYKKKLDIEKEKILNIIDELSNINYELDSIKSNNQNQNIKLNQNNLENSGFNEIKNNLINEVNNKINNFGSFELENKIRNLVDKDSTYEKSYFSDKIYYDISQKLDDNGPIVDGMYVEPPYI